MPQTSLAAASAERRRRGARSRGRASSPLALVAWAAMAGILTFGQLQRAEEEDASAVAMGIPLVGGPSGGALATPFTTSLPAPFRELVERPVALPRIVSAPLAEEPERRPRTRPVELKRPFATLGHPTVAFASPLLMPRLHLPRVLEPRLGALQSLLSRARPGEPVAVRLSAYCLQGTTRRGSPVRSGIIAADPRVFPLARHVELYAGGRYLGRYLVDDTGHHIKGTRIDIWTPDCDDARRFGTRDGVAALVALGG